MTTPADAPLPARLARAVATYRALATMLLTMFVAVALFELAAHAGLKVYPPRPGAAPLHPELNAESHAWFTARSWSRDFWSEHRRAIGMIRYEPFVVWRLAPFTGTWTNIDRDGLRHTPGANCRPGVPKVFLFGGSTMWGWGSPDSGTIAAYLQAAFASGGQPICIVNFAQVAFISTQELIELERQVARGNVPDAAVFYDGFNDCREVWRWRVPGVHKYLKNIALQFRREPSRRGPVAELTRTTAMFRLYDRLHPKPPDLTLPPVPPDSVAALASATVATWHANLRMAAALGREFGFATVFFAQPWMGVGAKPLTAGEQLFAHALGDNLCREVYRRSRVAAPGDIAPQFLDDVFDTVTAPLFIDNVHLNPDGNALVAARIVPLVSAALAARRRRNPHG